MSMLLVAGSLKVSWSTCEPASHQNWTHLRSISRESTGVGCTAASANPWRKEKTKISNHLSRKHSGQLQSPFISQWRFPPISGSHQFQLSAIILRLLSPAQHQIVANKTENTNNQELERTKLPVFVVEVALVKLANKLFELFLHGQVVDVRLIRLLFRASKVIGKVDSWVIKTFHFPCKIIRSDRVRAKTRCLSAQQPANLPCPCPLSKHAGGNILVARLQKRQTNKKKSTWIMKTWQRWTARGKLNQAFACCSSISAVRWTCRYVTPLTAARWRTLFPIR